VLSSLLSFGEPLDEIAAALGELEWDAEPVVTLTRKHIADVLCRYRAGLLRGDEVERWANLIECREDIDFERGHEPVIADAIFDLSNPDLQGPLATVADEVLASVQP